MYLTLENFDRAHISKPDSEFLVGLVSEKEDVLRIYSKVLAETSNLNMKKAWFLHPEQKFFKILIKLRIKIGDTPQKHHDGTMMYFSGLSSSCTRCMCRHFQITLPPRAIEDEEKNNKKTVDINDTRTVERVKTWLRNWNERLPTLNTVRRRKKPVKVSGKRKRDQFEQNSQNQPSSKKARKQKHSPSNGNDPNQANNPNQANEEIDPNEPNEGNDPNEAIQEDEENEENEENEADEENEENEANEENQENDGENESNAGNQATTPVPQNPEIAKKSDKDEDESNTSDSHVRCYGNNKGMDFLAYPNLEDNPFFTFFEETGFDVFQDTLSDVFHLEVIGLMKTHFELLLSKSFLKQPIERQKFLDYVCDFSQSTLTCKLNNVDISHRAEWNSDQWMKLYAIVPFALRRIVSETSNDVSKENFLKALNCWVLHQSYYSILLQESLTVEEIEIARTKCINWRSEMLKIYPRKSLFKVVNFHAILHVFDVALTHGPPILSWARPFEHKHKIIRAFLCRSNHKDPLQFAGYREKLIQYIRLCFPGLKETRRNITLLKRGDLVNYRQNATEEYLENEQQISRIPNKNSYGVISKRTADTYTIFPLKVSKQFGLDKTIDCYFFGTTKSSLDMLQDVENDISPVREHRDGFLSATLSNTPLEVKRVNIFERLSIVDGYVNKYIILNLSRV